MRAKIATTQATHTLLQLHAELGGKIIDNKKEATRLAGSMRHVEAVLKLLEKNKWDIPGNVEFEYAGDPIVEVGKCLQYCREALG